MSQKMVEFVETDIIKINGEASLKDIYREIDGYELFVEPLSAEQPIGDFILEGGLGFNSFKEGSFGSKLFGIKVSSPAKSFEYGTDYMTLYNVGFPLHRIMEGSPHPVYDREFGKIIQVTVPIRLREEIEARYIAKDVEEIFPPKTATNLLFLNDFGARLIGLDSPGWVATYPKDFPGEGKLKNEIWEKRFLLDRLPKNHGLLNAFSLRSGLGAIFRSFKGVEGLFLALVTKKGVLIKMSGEEARLKDIEGKISKVSMRTLIWL
ncbi:MAG: hypothetical protein AB1466_02170 [Actinomycetota bacterium]